MRYYMEVFRDFFRELWQRFKNWKVRSWRSFRRISHNFALRFPVLFLVASILFSVFCFFRITDIPKTQYDQKAAEFWSGDAKRQYRQLTVASTWQKTAGGAAPLFLDGQSGLNVRSIETIRESLDAAVEASINALDQTGGSAGRPRPQGGASGNVNIDNTSNYWIDAYSTEAFARITKPASDINEESKTADVMVSAVGGDYFLIRGSLIRSGSFFTKIDYGSRPIVLDEGLAFLLFSSSDIQGFEVEIAGVTFEVCGVVRKNPGKDNESMYGEYPRAYIPFQEISVLSASDEFPMSGDRDLPADTEENDNTRPVSDMPGDDSYKNTYAVMYYEAVLPDHLSGIGTRFLKEAFDSTGSPIDTNFLLIENTGRFRLDRIWNTFFPVGENERKSRGFELPFYELSARSAESRIFFWWTLLFITILTGIINIVTIYLRYNRKRKKIQKQFIKE